MTIDCDWASDRYCRITATPITAPTKFAIFHWKLRIWFVSIWGIKDFFSQLARKITAPVEAIASKPRRCDSNEVEMSLAKPPNGPVWPCSMLKWNPSHSNQTDACASVVRATGGVLCVGRVVPVGFRFAAVEGHGPNGTMVEVGGASCVYRKPHRD